MDLEFPKGGAKLGAHIVGAKNRLIQLVVQCEKHTQHEEHVLSRGSGESLTGKICKFSFLRSNLALIFYSRGGGSS